MSLPNNITNGQVIDAVPVMANFNSLDGRMPASNAVAAKSGANADITSLTGLTTPLAVSEGGTGDSGTAWTSLALTITAFTGAFTTAAATLRYKIVGKTVFFSVQINITTNGTAATYIILSGFPWTWKTPGCGFVGYNGSGIVCVGAGAAAGTAANIFKYDGSYPGASAATIVLSGTGELT